MLWLAEAAQVIGSCWQLKFESVGHSSCLLHRIPIVMFWLAEAAQVLTSADNWCLKVAKNATVSIAIFMVSSSLCLWSCEEERLRCVTEVYITSWTRLFCSSLVNANQLDYNLRSSIWSTKKTYFIAQNTALEGFTCVPPHTALINLCSIIIKWWYNKPTNENICTVLTFSSQHASSFGST